ncbi:AI-2E family transporter [Trichothermofontia sp.]
MRLIDWVGLIFLGIALIILWQFRQILLLIFTAVVLATALNSLVRWITNRFQLQRGKAVLVAMLIVLLATVLFVGLVMPPFIQQFQQLLQLVPVGFTRFSVWLDRLLKDPPDWILQQNLQLPRLGDLSQQTWALGKELFGNLFTFLNNSLGVLLQLLLVLVLTIMILADPLAYRRLAVRLMPSFYRRRTDEIMSRCEIALLSWLGGVSFNSIFVATLCAIGLLVLQVRFVFAHALLAGVFNFVPNIGPTVSGVFPVAVALLDSPGKALAVVILYVVVQNLESYWFSPMVMQKQVSLLPAATLIAQIFFATFFGLLGLILALPLAVVVKIWVEEAFIKDFLDYWSGSLPSEHARAAREPDAVTGLPATPAAIPEPSLPSAHESMLDETSSGDRSQQETP